MWCEYLLRRVVPAFLGYLRGVRLLRLYGVFDGERSFQQNLTRLVFTKSPSWDIFMLISNFRGGYDSLNDPRRHSDPTLEAIQPPFLCYTSSHYLYIQASPPEYHPLSIEAVILALGATWRALCLDPLYFEQNTSPDGQLRD